MADFGSINGNIPSSLPSAYGAGAAQGVRSTGDASAQRVEAKPAATRAADRVEVSEVARWLEEMNRLPAIREDKVAAARAAIANGTLDSDERLSIAVARMMDDIG